MRVKYYIIILLSIITIPLGAYSFYMINKYIYPIWNSNKVYVITDKNLIKKNIKIDYGISVNSNNNCTLYKNRGYTTIYNGKTKNSIYNEYGENDFLITYNNNYYLCFRHFKTDKKNQHYYCFRFLKKENKIFVNISIIGQDEMVFESEMKLISNTTIKKKQ